MNGRRTITSNRNLHDKATNIQLHSAVQFGEKYYDDMERARAIFSNIIKNKGTFIP